MTTMDSIRELYKIGMGPSSSHTMGPRKAALLFKERHPAAAKYAITLYGSLAATGKGHMTDKAVSEPFAPAPVDIIWEPEKLLPHHPNGMLFTALSAEGGELGRWQGYSIGGGSIRSEEDWGRQAENPVYKLRQMQDILDKTSGEGKGLWEYVVDCEGQDIYSYMEKIWSAMKETITRGLDTEGVLPGGLGLPRKAASYYLKAMNQHEYLQRLNLIFAYALASSEENASGATVVTAPTCGSCGILPAALYFYQTNYKASDKMIYKALMTAGIVGNLAKHNASISGAEVGCQGEVGVACAMAAAASAQLMGGTPYQIEYAAEMGLEHHLGLTCDPVCGLVQIPCIERNAMAAPRAMDCAAYALLSDGRHRVSYDAVVDTMAQTGWDMKSIYRETSKGGLAKELGEMIYPS